MATLTIRNVPEPTHRALVAKARANGRSMEAEARGIVEVAVRPPDRARLGSLLAAIGEAAGGLDLSFTRGAEATEPASFG
jgi:plasmid stability protein